MNSYRRGLQSGVLVNPKLFILEKFNLGPPTICWSNLIKLVKNLYYSVRVVTLVALKNVQIPIVSEFDEIRRDSWISLDDSNGEIRFVIQDLEKFLILTEITILPFFRKLEFSRVLQVSFGFVSFKT